MRPPDGNAELGSQVRAVGLLWLGLLAIAGLVLCTNLAAVDVPNRNPPGEERAVREARAAIARSQWARALELLGPHVRAHPDDADAHNLTGFSLRKLGRYGESQTAYERALAIDPGHLGAHEYLGELMLILGRRDRALHHLRELERLCQARCEEYDDLRRAYERPPGQPPKR